jgi:hypothetical protein
MNRTMFHTHPAGASLARAQPCCLPTTRSLQ